MENKNISIGDKLINILDISQGGLAYPLDTPGAGIYSYTVKTVSEEELERPILIASNYDTHSDWYSVKNLFLYEDYLKVVAVDQDTFNISDIVIPTAFNKDVENNRMLFSSIYRRLFTSTEDCKNYVKIVDIVYEEFEGKDIISHILTICPITGRQKMMPAGFFELYQNRALYEAKPSFALYEMINSKGENKFLLDRNKNILYRNNPLMEISYEKYKEDFQLCTI